MTTKIRRKTIIFADCFWVFEQKLCVHNLNHTQQLEQLKKKFTTGNEVKNIASQSERKFVSFKKFATKNKRQHFSYSCYFFFQAFNKMNRLKQISSVRGFIKLIFEVSW